MKKIIALLLAALLLGACLAQAESAATVYDALSGLMNDKTYTLTVTAKSDTDELAEVISRYGTVTCVLRQENGEILLNAACDGDAYLNAALTAEEVRFDTNLIETGAFACDWAALAPEISVKENEISIRMTGPDHELITFSCTVSGSDPADCEAEVHIGFITGPGNVHSLWDGITCHESEAEREFYFTFSEEEYAIEGEGAAAVETNDDGSTTITREEICTVTYQEDELGGITFRSTLTIH